MDAELRARLIAMENKYMNFEDTDCPKVNSEHYSYLALCASCLPGSHYKGSVARPFRMLQLLEETGFARANIEPRNFAEAKEAMVCIAARSAAETVVEPGIPVILSRGWHKWLKKMTHWFTVAFKEYCELLEMERNGILPCPHATTTTTTVTTTAVVVARPDAEEVVVVVGVPVEAAEPAVGAFGPEVVQ